MGFVRTENAMWRTGLWASGRWFDKENWAREFFHFGNALVI